MKRDQLDDVGEVLMGAAQVAQAAGQLGLDQLGERQDRQSLDRGYVLPITRAGKRGRLPRPLAFAGKDELDGRPAGGAKFLRRGVPSEAFGLQGGTEGGRILGPDEQIEVHGVPPIAVKTDRDAAHDGVVDALGASKP